MCVCSNALLQWSGHALNLMFVCQSGHTWLNLVILCVLHCTWHCAWSGRAWPQPINTGCNTFTHSGFSFKHGYRACAMTWLCNIVCICFIAHGIVYVHDYHHHTQDATRSCIAVYLQASRRSISCLRSHGDQSQDNKLEEWWRNCSSTSWCDVQRLPSTFHGQL